MRMPGKSMMWIPTRRWGKVIKTCKTCYYYYSYHSYYGDSQEPYDSGFCEAEHPHEHTWIDNSCELWDDMRIHDLIRRVRWLEKKAGIKQNENL